MARECDPAERASWVCEQVQRCQKAVDAGFVLGALQLLLVTHKALLPTENGLFSSVSGSVIPLMLELLERQPLTG